MVKEGEVYYDPEEKRYFKIIKINSNHHGEYWKDHHLVGWDKRTLEDAMKTHMTYWKSDKHIKSCKKINTNDLEI